MNNFTRMPEPVFTIQEWLAHPLNPTLNNKPIRYAKWWLSKRLASVQEQLMCLDIDGGHKLFVSIGGKRYQVTAVNRFGELNLLDLNEERPLDGEVHSRECMFLLRNETDCTEWSNTAEGPLNESKFVPYVSPFHSTVKDTIP